MKGAKFMSTEDEVRKASKQFYGALNQMVSGNASALSDIWSHGQAVTTLHPISGRQVGWDEVRGSWEQVAQLASDGKVELKDQLIHVVGDAAYEVGIEDGEFKIAGQAINAHVRVTNIYQKEGGTWKIIHHHTDIEPSFVELLNKLQSK
jgi:ketosteroid isomerase-like protein